MVIQGIRVLNMAPEAQRPDSSLSPARRHSGPAQLDVAIAPGQCCGWIDGAHGWSGMKTAVFRRWIKDARVEETRLDSGEITVHVVPTGNQITVAVAGRVTVDSSPTLRSALLELLRRSAAPVIVIDLSGVSYLDMSGLATLLEALKAARAHSVKLRVTGITGKARTLAEIAQLDKVFRAWGSEVEFR